MSKKIIILGIALVVVVSTATYGILLLVRPFQQPTPKISKEVTKLSADGSRDYGACTLLDKNIIKSTIGKVASNLQGPDTVGLALLSNGDQVQVCAYSFIEGGTTENQFNVADGFSLEVFIHKDAKSQSAYSALHDTGAEIISGIGDKATYTSETFTDGHVSYRLVVYTGLRHYAFVINQPADLKKFTKDSAKQMLVTIAKSANY